MRKTFTLLLCSILLFTVEIAVGAELPIDKSDKLVPGLVSVQFDKTAASPGEEVGLKIVIRDDKNAMYVSQTIELDAPAEAGTAYKTEGYSRWVKNPVLSERKIGNGYIEETWIGSIKAPSYPGLWKGYRIDFGDLAGNRVQFITNGDNTCTLKYTQLGFYQTNLPCTFMLNLTVSGNVLNERVTIPAFNQIEELQKNIRELNNLVLVLKGQVAKASGESQKLQTQIKKICSAKPKPKGC